MSKCKMIQKAGKLTFLLVCLFLCTSCRSEKAVFEAGEVPQIETFQENLDDTEEKETEIPPQSEEAIKNSLININTADSAKLETLPGIGKTRAAAIIAYREEMGEFQKIEDIMNVKGIKTGIFKKISSLICVK